MFIQRTKNKSKLILKNYSPKLNDIVYLSGNFPLTQIQCSFSLTIHHYYACLIKSNISFFVSKQNEAKLRDISRSLPSFTSKSCEKTLSQKKIKTTRLLTTTTAGNKISSFLENEKENKLRVIKKKEKRREK